MKMLKPDQSAKANEFFKTRYKVISSCVHVLAQLLDPSVPKEQCTYLKEFLGYHPGLLVAYAALELDLKYQGMNLILIQQLKRLCSMHPGFSHSPVMGNRITRGCDGKTSELNDIFFYLTVQFEYFSYLWTSSCWLFVQNKRPSSWKEKATA